MGFTGKLSIHPSQIEPINAAFTPTPQEVAEAEELIALFTENANQGITAFRHKGQMVDTPHLKNAPTAYSPPPPDRGGFKRRKTHQHPIDTALHLSYP